MDPDPDRNVGYTDLSGKSDSALAAPVIVATPAVTHPGAGPSSAPGWVTAGVQYSLNFMQEKRQYDLISCSMAGALASEG